MLVDFILSIAAGIIVYLISKWLDRYFNDNEPDE